MLRLFYRACRLLTYIIIIAAIIFVLSKLIPIISSVFDSFFHFIKSLPSTVKGLTDSIRI